jgi:hypothetical protein
MKFLIPHPAISPDRLTPEAPFPNLLHLSSFFLSFLSFRFQSHIPGMYRMHRAVLRSLSFAMTMTIAIARTYSAPTRFGLPISIVVDSIDRSVFDSI